MKMFRSGSMVAILVTAGGLALSSTPSLAAAAATATSSRGCEITSVDLGGAYPGSRFNRSEAYAINDNGQVVGYAATVGLPPGSPTGAVVWNRDGTRTDLGHLPGTLATTAVDINNQGTIVGDGLTTDFVNRALVWSRAPGGGYTITDLGEGFATGINNRGLIVGILDGAAVIWDRKLSPMPLPGLPGGTSAYLPEGINDSGTVVGFADDADGNVHGVVWNQTASGGYTVYDLGPDARPQGINNQGVIAGFVTNAGPDVPAVWTPAPGGGYTLTLIAPYGQAGHAVSINSAGQIVGNIFVDGVQMAVLWTPLPGGGYSMTTLGVQANDINSSGEVVGLASNVHATIWGGFGPGCVRRAASAA